MRVRNKLKPGENGTGVLVREYGEQLVCVRYRYDRKRFKRYKTVEIIVVEKDWQPETRIPVEKRVYFRIGYGEKELRELVKQAGACWNPDLKAWHHTYRKVIEPGLESRIIDPELNFQLAHIPTELPHMPTPNIVLIIAGNTAC